MSTKICHHCKNEIEEGQERKYGKYLVCIPCNKYRNSADYKRQVKGPFQPYNPNPGNHPLFYNQIFGSLVGNNVVSNTIKENHNV